MGVHFFKFRCPGAFLLINLTIYSFPSVRMSSAGDPLKNVFSEPLSVLFRITVTQPSSHILGLEKNQVELLGMGHADLIPGF